jgi:hypothetical protein
MGNQAAKMGGQAFKATDNVRKRMTVRRRRPDQESEFNAEEIQRKFEHIPTLTDQEKLILKTSWIVISKKVEQVSIFLKPRFLHILEQVLTTNS